MFFVVLSYFKRLHSELQIGGDTKNNSKIIFLISQGKHVVTCCGL